MRQACKGGGGPDQGLCQGAALSLFSAPANTVLLAEVAQVGGGNNPNETSNLNDPENDLNDTNNLHSSAIFKPCNDVNDGHPAIGTKASFGCTGGNLSFHDSDQGGLNYLAFDGHVKYLRANAVDGVLPNTGGLAPDNLSAPYVMTYNPK